jgi:hypothetical protein
MGAVSPELDSCRCPGDDTVKIILPGLILTIALSVAALPVHAGQWLIEESDDGYLVEYQGDAPAKPAEKPAAKPAAVPPAGRVVTAPAPANPEVPTTGAPDGPAAPDRRERTRNPNRRQRVPGNDSSE